MRYILLSYLSGGEGTLYQIHDDEGNFLRFADMDGNTIEPVAPPRAPFSATLVAADVEPPSWHAP
jgi:hypothetical protein